MNKLLTKIATGFVGIAMAFGVGVAIGTRSEAREASAAEKTVTFTMKGWGGVTDTGYQNSNVEGTGSITGGGTVTAKAYAFNGNNGQVRGNKTSIANSTVSDDNTKNWHLYNTEAIGGAIKSIVVSTSSATSSIYFKGSLYVALGTSSLGDVTTTSGAESATPTAEISDYADTFTFSGLNGTNSYTYFKIMSTVNFTQSSVTNVSVTLTYVESGVTNHNVTYKAGTYGKGSDNVISVAEGASHTVLNPSDVGISAGDSYQNYVFDTWKDGSNVSHAPDSSITMGQSDINLTAQWVAGKELIYNPNGGSGSAITQYVKSGVATDVKPANTFTRDGYAFVEWNDAQDGSGNSYIPGDAQKGTIAITGTKNLYAIWEIVHSGEITSFTSASGSVVENKINYSTAKGGGTSNPYVNAGTITLYQPGSGQSRGGTLTVTALTGYTIAEIVFQSTSDTTVAYTVDQESEVTGQSVSADTDFTIDDIDAEQVVIACCGADKNHRLVLSYLKVTYNVSLTKSISITTSKPLAIRYGDDALLEFSYANLTTPYTVTSGNSNLVEVKTYTGAQGTGSGSVTLHGKGLTNGNNVTITVSSASDASDTISVSVEILPLINTNLSSLVWGSTTYATSPHVATWNTSYQFIVTAGQYDSDNVGFIGTNNNNSSYSTLNNDNCALKGSSLLSAVNAESATYPTYTYGAAFYMSNFGVLHPTEFTVNLGTVGSIGTNRTWVILASEDSGSTWEVLIGGNSTSSGAIVAETDLSWTSNSKYSSNSNNIQFAFFTSYSSCNTIKDISIVCYGDSYATTKVLDHIYIDGTPVKTYTVGQQFDLGTARVMASYTDSTTYPDEPVTASWPAITHGMTEITGTYEGKSVTVTGLTVDDVGDTYKKATSLNELLDGSRVVLGTNTGTAAMGAQAQHNRNSEQSGFADGYLTVYSINTAVFTIEIIEENEQTYYAFKDSNDKYLYAGATNNNYLYSGTTLTDAGKWSLNISNTGVVQATVSVAVSETPTTKYLAGTASAFGCYTSLGTTSLSIYIDVAHNVQLFVDNYMEMTNDDYDTEAYVHLCDLDDGQGNTPYSLAKEALLALGSDYISEFQNNSTFNDAQARYEWWARANHDSTPYAAPSGSGRINILGGGDNAVNSIAIAIISVTSLAAIGGYFFIRKKKEI